MFSVLDVFQIALGCDIDSQHWAVSQSICYGRFENICLRCFQFWRFYSRKRTKVSVMDVLKTSVIDVFGFGRFQIGFSSLDSWFKTFSIIPVLDVFKTSVIDVFKLR